MPDMFNGLEDSEIVGDANFTVDGEGKMFEDAKKLKIGGGSFLATGGMTTLFNSFFLLATEPRPFSEDGPEMFKRLEHSTLTNGEFVAEGNGKMFEKSKNLIIGGGNYTSSGSSPRKSKTTPKPYQRPYQQGAYIIVR